MKIKYNQVEENSYGVSFLTVEELLKMNLSTSIKKKSIKLGNGGEDNRKSMKIDDSDELLESYSSPFSILLNISKSEDMNLKSLDEVEDFIKNNEDISILYNGELYINDNKMMCVVDNDSIYVELKERIDGNVENFEKEKIEELKKKKIQISFIENSYNYLMMNKYVKNNKVYGSDIYSKFGVPQKSRTKYSFSYYFFKRIKSDLGDNFFENKLTLSLITRYFEIQTELIKYKNNNFVKYQESYLKNDKSDKYSFVIQEFLNEMKKYPNGVKLNNYKMVFDNYLTQYDSKERLITDEEVEKIREEIEEKNKTVKEKLEEKNKNMKLRKELEKEMKEELRKEMKEELKNELEEELREKIKKENKEKYNSSNIILS